MILLDDKIRKQTSVKVPGIAILISKFGKWIVGVDPSGRAVQGMGLRPLAFRDFGFESWRGYGCLSVVNVVRCQADVPSTDRSFVQRSSIESVCMYVFHGV